jgi:hypothetical protein
MASSYLLAQIVDRKSGSTRKDELIAMSKMRGRLHPDLEYPALPPIFSPIIHTFNSLSSYSYQEVESYTRMTGIKLDGFDMGLLQDLDYINQSASRGQTVKQILGQFHYG